MRRGGSLRGRFKFVFVLMYNNLVELAFEIRESFVFFNLINEYLNKNQANVVVGWVELCREIFARVLFKYLRLTF